MERKKIFLPDSLEKKTPSVIAVVTAQTGKTINSRNISFLPENPPSPARRAAGG
jgi:hypothetical protein